MDKHSDNVQRGFRKVFNASAADDMQRWCRDHGVLLHISNHGYHWSFHLPDKQLWEWWPPTARLVKNKQWDHSMCVTDSEKVKQLIAAALEGHDGK